MDLFTDGVFTAHSGLQLPWKIDCDALGDDSIATLAKIIAAKFAFTDVIGIPRGGLRLATALKTHCGGDPVKQTLLVDDVR